MDHGLMQGMLVGGILLSVFPIALGIALCVAGWREYREHRASARTGVRSNPAASAPPASGSPGPPPL